MSNLVTFDQKQVLRKLGYDFDSICFFGGAMDCICEHLPDENKLITVSEALDWVREEKGIACGVYPNIDVYDEDIYPFIGYSYVYYNGTNFIKEDDLDTHPLANSALLTAVLNYLKEKEI